MIQCPYDCRNIGCDNGVYVLSGEGNKRLNSRRVDRCISRVVCDYIQSITERSCYTSKPLTSPIPYVDRVLNDETARTRRRTISGYCVVNQIGLKSARSTWRTLWVARGHLASEKGSRRFRDALR